MSRHKYDGKVNGHGEDGQKFLKELMKLAPAVHRSGILENRHLARKNGYKSVEDALNKRLDKAAAIEQGKAGIIDKWMEERLFGGKEFPRLLPKWAEKKIRAGEKWPWILFGYQIKIISDRDEKTGLPTTTAAIYRFFMLKMGQRFIWEGNYNAGFN